MIMVQITATTLLLSISISLCLSHTKAMNNSIIKIGDSINVSETIVSYEGMFELGFFKSQDDNLYVGIWYKNISRDRRNGISEHECVWVADRDYPVLSSSASLAVRDDGNIVISDGRMFYMVTNVSSSASNVAELLDSGNFVLRGSGSEDGFIWQSFDYPSNSLLPGMRLLSDANSSLVSWKSKRDPSPGKFSLTLDSVSEQLVVKNRDDNREISKKHVGLFNGMVLKNGYLSFDTKKAFSEIFRLVLKESGEIKLEPLNSEQENESFSNPKHSKVHGRLVRNVLIITSVIVVVVFLSTVYACIRIRKLRGKGENLFLLDVEISLKHNRQELPELNPKRKGRKKSLKLAFFSYSSVVLATDNFSEANKIGEGGFGPVYKGTLLKGDEVAVKRLSKKSRQGLEQFKNEAHLVARLQHKNLVRLLGCCIEKKEKILIYEYMPNKSLDSFLYDSTKRKHLTWTIRVKIIEGIAQGLLYLHKYSRIKIVHCDVKPGNILLDIDMNPKISDFGMAKTFSFSRPEENIGRPDGTLGYMSPDYGQKGLFSDKSDVYSFGVLLLEILSGKRNTDSHNAETCGLVAYAWELWTRDRGIDLLDPLIHEDANAIGTVLRYIHIALLCVQELVVDRPSMSQVLSMLCNSSEALPYPNQPGFLSSTSFAKSTPRHNPIEVQPEVHSANSVSISVLEPR